MKKILVVIMCVFILITAGCNKNESDKGSEQQATQTITNKTTASVTVTKAASPTVAQKDRIEQLLNYFKSNNLTVGEKEEKAYEMIGANNGCAVYINGSKIEIYSFDLKSDNELTKRNLQSAKNNGTVSAIGIPINVKLNGDLIICNYEDHPDKDKIIELFSKFK